MQWNEFTIKAVENKIKAKINYVITIEEDMVSSCVIGYMHNKIPQQTALIYGTEGGLREDYIINTVGEDIEKYEKIKDKRYRYDNYYYLKNKIENEAKVEFQNQKNKNGHKEVYKDIDNELKLFVEDFVCKKGDPTFEEVYLNCINNYVKVKYA